MTWSDQAIAGRFRVRLWSEGAGAPLVYLHGLEQHPGAASFLQRLAQRRRVYAPEHPGYGRSTGFEHIDDTLDMTLFYRQFVESLAGDPVDLIGHDLGGMFAAELAALCPYLVRRLVLVDAYGLWLDDAPAPDVFALSPEDLKRAKWHDPAAAPDPEPSISPPDPANPGAAALERTQNLGVATKFLWPLPDRGLQKRLPLIKAPTLVVWGESDGLLPLAYGRALAALIPNARLATIPQAGHLPMLEREDAFLQAVEAFLGG